MVGGNIGEGVGTHRAHGRAVHQNIHDVVADVGGDGEALVGAGGDIHAACRGDAPAETGGGGDGVGTDGVEFVVIRAYVDGTIQPDGRGGVDPIARCKLPLLGPVGVEGVELVVTGA